MPWPRTSNGLIPLQYRSHVNFPIWTRLIVIPPSGSCRNRDSFDPSGSVQTTRYRTTRGTTTYATLHACKSSARHCHRPSHKEARCVVPYIRHTVRFTLKCGTASVSSFRGQPSATRRLFRHPLNRRTTNINRERITHPAIHHHLRTSRAQYRERKPKGSVFLTTAFVLADPFSASLSISK